MKISLIVMSSLLFLASCSSAGPITATSNKIGSIKGESCKRNILFIIPLASDNSIHTAAKNAELSLISTVDSESFTSLIYNSRCTVVYGDK